MTNWEYLKDRIQQLTNIECIWARQELNLEHTALEFHQLRIHREGFEEFPIELAAFCQDRNGKYYITELDGDQMLWEPKEFRLKGELYRGGENEVSIADLNSNVVEFQSEGLSRRN